MPTLAQIQKKHLGQFFTTQDSWLRPHIVNFIKLTQKKIACDPFAGAGDLLSALKSLGFRDVIGLDIDSSLGWEHNDSLMSIPQMEGAIIVTNPPYLTNYSAKRKRIYDHVAKYFESCNYDDLYQLAIEKCLKNKFGVMIIPETFINSSFPKNRLSSITILEENLFQDTENPVCVICFDARSKGLDEVTVYKNDTPLGNLSYFEKLRMKPKNSIQMDFNEISGSIALRAVDTTDPQNLIAFMKKEELAYDLAGIKHSSRLITIIDAPARYDELDLLISQSNRILTDYRKRTHDVLLSPFKGNRKDGIRRRRLDYATARAILETAYDETFQPKLA